MLTFNLHFLRNDTFNDELYLKKKINLYSPVKVSGLRFHLIDYKYCSLFLISQNKWKSLKTTLPMIISLVAQKSCLPQIFRGGPTRWVPSDHEGVGDLRGLGF